MAISEVIKIKALMMSCAIVTASFSIGMIIMFEENTKLNNDNLELIDENDGLINEKNILSADLVESNNLVDELSDEITDLEEENSDYWEELNLWKNTTNNLNLQIKNLLTQVNALEITKRSLENQTEDLKDDISDLEDDIDDLEDDVNSLNSEITSLNSQISSLNSQIADLNFQIDSLQAENDGLTWENNEWWDIYYMRTGDYPYWLVTPDDSTIIAYSQVILGANADGDLTWADMGTINDWVHSNIDYSYDQYMLNPYSIEGRQDFWQTPYETLDRGEGDCDDFANLALSLMLAEENVGWLWGCHVAFDDDAGHAAIFVNVADDQMHVFDPTWGYDTIITQDEPGVLDEWAFIGGHSSVTDVFRIYSDTTEVEFDGLSEFYSWF